MLTLSGFVAVCPIYIREILNPVNWIGWHVYGLLHQSDKNYGEALKCYTRTLKFDKVHFNFTVDFVINKMEK